MSGEGSSPRGKQKRELLLAPKANTPVLVAGIARTPLLENSTSSRHHTHRGQGKQFGQPEITGNDAPRACALFNRIPLGTHQGEGGDLLNSPRLLLLRENSSGQPHALRSPPSTRPHPGQHCGTHAHIGNYHTTATTKYLDTLRDFPSRVTALRKLPRVCSRVSELQ